mgnify:FL=1
MANLRLISVRLENETIEALDRLAEKTEYRNRSQIMQNILRNVLTCAGPNDLWQIIDTRFAYEKGYTVDFHADAQLCQQRNQRQD